MVGGSSTWCETEPVFIQKYRVFFLLVPPRKVLSTELVPPNRERLLSSLEMAKILTKKVKVQVSARHTLISSAKLQQKLKV